MVETTKAFLASIFSALLVLIVYVIAGKIMTSKTLTGLVVATAVFLIGFIGMKWEDWRK